MNYTLDGAKGLLSMGGSARKAAAEGAGGKVESLPIAFGSTDVYIIAEHPDHASAPSSALTVSAGRGATVTTTVLLTPDEVDQAAGANLEYRPPGS